MGAAKYEIKTQDRSVILASIDGIYAAAVVISDKGKTYPQLITSPTQHETRFGTPRPGNGVSQYGVNTFLSQSNKIWINRAVHADAKYAAALVSSKVDSIPLTIPNGSWEPDRIIKPIKGGLTEEELQTYQFPTYSTDRAYVKLDNAFVYAVSAQKTARVNKLTGLKVGDKLYLGSGPKNDSPLHTITKLEDNYVNFDKLTLADKVTVKQGDYIKMVHIDIASYPQGIIINGTQSQGIKKLIVTANGTQVQPNDVLSIGDQTCIAVSATDTEITIKDELQKDIASGTEVKKMTVTYQEYQGNPYVTRDSSGSNEILISKSDFVGNGDKICIGNKDGISVQSVEVVKKDTYTETHHYVTFDNKFTGNADTEFHKMVHSEFEDRDAFLVTFDSVSKLGNFVSIAIAPTTDYTEEDVTDEFLMPFNLIVYYKGKEVETFKNVAMKYQLDGNNTQMFIESRINGVSNYIMVKVNPNNVDNKGNPLNPLVTNYSIWRKLPDDIFWEIKESNSTNMVTITEDLLTGDLNIRVTDNTGISLGDRIKFYGYNEEYKVVNKSSYQFGGNTIYDITLDRGVIITDDNPIRKIPAGTKVTRFDASVEKTDEGIYAGVRHYRPTKIDKVYYNYPLNVIFTISGVKGTLLDSGANLLQGGSAGSSPTVGDIVKAFKPFYNKDKYQIQLFMDTGHTFPAVAQEINSLCLQRGGTAHGYLSIDPQSEQKADYTKAINDYYNTLMLNSELVSVFTGWIKVLDENNNIELYIDPASAGAASQAYTTRNYRIFYPGAGWTRGKVKGLGVLREFSEGDMDFLVDNRMNPIRYKEGSGLVIWGNETTYRKPSPLQMRSVAWLLIMIKFGLESTLDFSLFELNDEDTYDRLETAIRTFMRDEVKAPGGVYDFQVEISKIITDSDKEQRRVPVFLGIQPTSDVKMIPVTLAVFSASQKIEVSL